MKEDPNLNYWFMFILGFVLGMTSGYNFFYSGLFGAGFVIVFIIAEKNIFDGVKT